MRKKDDLEIESFLSKGFIIPQHVSFIIDGNRRWSQQNNCSQFEGYLQGFKVALQQMINCKKLGIKYNTVFVLSTENKNRTLQERFILNRILLHALRKLKPYLIKNQLCTKILGNKKDLIPSLQSTINIIESETAVFDQYHVNLAINYGGRWEILEILKKLISTHQDNLEDLNEETIHEYFLLSGQPDPEIMIRTGGAKRISNFLLWELAYTELFFTDTLWPDFTLEELINIIKQYNNIKRNFGK